MNWKTCYAFAVLVTWSTSVNGSDIDGNYAVRGTGALACSAASEAATGPAGSLDLFVRWLEGYLSATNRTLPSTYDASPFVEMRDLTILVLNVCATQPDITFESATAAVLDAIHPIRSAEQSDIETVEYQGVRALIRRDTLARLQEALSAAGLYASDVDGLYGPGTRSALLQFQEENGLEQTGVPDRQTIIRILAE